MRTKFQSLCRVSVSLINRLTQPKSFRLILILPVLLYVVVTLFWHSRHFYGITGDEPHYLLISDSLVRDHDLLVENNYLIDTPVRQASQLDLSAPIHVGPHVAYGFSRHNIGLPLILAIQYGLG